MGLGQYILNTVLLDLRQLCEIDEKHHSMGPLTQLLQLTTKSALSLLFYLFIPFPVFRSGGCGQS